jgi:hypothetical protein
MTERKPLRDQELTTRPKIVVMDDSRGSKYGPTFEVRFIEAHSGKSRHMLCSWFPEAVMRANIHARINASTIRQYEALGGAA